MNFCMSIGTEVPVNGAFKALNIVDSSTVGLFPIDHWLSFDIMVLISLVEFFVYVPAIGPIKVCKKNNENEKVSRIVSKRINM